jgi:hypothetical protein
MRRIFAQMVFCALLSWATCAWAAGANEPVQGVPATNSSFMGDLQNFLRQEEGSLVSRIANNGSWVTSGGLHGTAGTCTSQSFAVDATTSSGNRITGDGASGTVSINYAASNIGGNCANPGSDVCWVVGSAQGQAFTTAGARSVLSVPTLPSSNFNRVASSNIYVDCTSVTQPALPSDSTYLMKTTITNGAIAAVTDLRVPLSFSRFGVYDITDTLYGAVNDGVTANDSAVETALNSAPDGSTVYVPGGTFLLSRNLFVPRSNITLKGNGAGSILKAKAGFTNSFNTGMIAFGVTSANGAASVSNITVRDITLDGTSLVRPLYLGNVTTGLISHITAINSGPTHPIISVLSSTDVTVEHSHVAGALGQFGDGIYFEQVVRPKALFNSVSDITRIGITTEGDPAGVKTSDVLIVGNNVTNAHNATGGQSNVAYWLENTDGGKVIGNSASNLTNTPGAAFTAGINLSGGSSANQTFIVVGNEISGAQYGLRINPVQTTTVEVDDLRVSGGALANYLGCVLIDTGMDIMISHVSCASNTYVNDLHGSVVITDNQLPINSITISDSVIGTMTHTNESADVNVTSTSAGLTTLTLRNLNGWRVNMRQAAARVIVSDSALTHRAATYPVIQSSGGLQVSNTRFTGTSVLTPFWFGTQAGVIDQFSNVVFDSVQATFSNAGGQRNWRCVSCTFINSSQFKFDGQFYLDFAGGFFNQWAAGGAIVKAGATTTGFDLRVRGMDFTHTDPTNTPVVMGGGNPGTTSYFGNTYNTTSFVSGDRVTISQSNNAFPQRAFADLGTPGNGTVYYCDDCVVTGAGDNTCALGGAGTGALAIRLNGVFRCFALQN